MIKYLDTNDKHFIVYSILITLAIVFVTLYFLPSTVCKDFNFWLTLISCLITTNALAFTMFQQFRLKNATAKVAENRTKYDNALRNNYYGATFNKVLNYCDKVEDVSLRKNPELVKFLLKQIKNGILDCKKVTNIHFGNKLEELLLNLNDNLNKKDVQNIIDEAKDKCCTDWAKRMMEHIVQLSSVQRNVLDLIEDRITIQEINEQKINEIVLNISDFVNEIKPESVINIQI